MGEFRFCHFCHCPFLKAIYLIIFRKTMNSFMGLKDISLTIYGLKKTIKGLTEDTVCDDVIETVFDTLAISKIYASSFAIYESASGVERKLSGKTRVLKLVRSWGADHAQYELIMKRRENLNENVDTVSENSFSSSTENDKYFSNKNEGEKNFTLMHKICYSEEKKPKLKRSKGCTKIQNCSRNSKPRNSEQNRSFKLPTAPETSGKMFILKKYMNDVMVYNKTMKSHSSKMQLIPRTPGDGSDLDCTPRLRNFQNDISSIRNSHNESRFTELEENIRTPGDGEHSVTAFRDSLDDAFVETDYSELMPGTPAKEFDGLNDAFLVVGEDLYDNDNDTVEDVASGRFCDNLDFRHGKSNVQKRLEAPDDGRNYRLNRISDNVETLKYILASVSSGTPSTSSSEDDLLESFMNTKLYEENAFRQCL